MRRPASLVIAILAVMAPGCSSSTSHKLTAPTPTTPSTAEASGSAYRQLELPAGTHRCGEATATTDMATLVAAFVAARLDGRGAEGCLTAAAKAHYSDKGCELSSLEATPGPIVLYGCGSHRIVSIPRDRVEVTKTGPTDVQLVIFVEGATGRELDEHLAIGPGRANGATSPAPQVILDVSPI